MTGTPNGDAPFTLDASYNFKADVEILDGGGEGMLISQGGHFGGYGFCLRQGRPVLTSNLVDQKRDRWEGLDQIPPGRHAIEFDFKYDGLGIATLAFNNLSGIGRSGVGVMNVDGQPAPKQKMERTLPLVLTWDESLDIGSDTLTGVNDDDYQPPFAFNGKIHKITLTVDRPKLSLDDEKRLIEAARNNKTSE
jgi:hypothetical protein